MTAVRSLGKYQTFVWILLGLLLAVSPVIALNEIPAPPDRHFHDIFDVLAAFKWAISTVSVPTIGALLIKLPYIIDNPHLIVNMIFITVGIYGAWLTIVAVEYHPPGFNISNDLTFNRGWEFIGISVSYFLGGNIAPSKNIQSGTSQI